MTGERQRASPSPAVAKCETTRPLSEGTSSPPQAATRSPREASPRASGITSWREDGRTRRRWRSRWRWAGRGRSGALRGLDRSRLARVVHDDDLVGDVELSARVGRGPGDSRQHRRCRAGRSFEPAKLSKDWRGHVLLLLLHVARVVHVDGLELSRLLLPVRVPGRATPRT